MWKTLLKKAKILTHEGGFSTKGSRFSKRADGLKYALADFVRDCVRRTRLSLFRNIN